jgi:hypothetical protein
MKTYIDPITGMPIEYTPEDCFAIKITTSHSNKRLLRIVSSEHLPEILKEYYELKAPKNSRKYFYKVHKDSIASKEGTLLFSMRGFHTNEKPLEVKFGRRPIEYATETITSLNSCPITLARKLKTITPDKCPPCVQKWTKAKIIYCAIAYLCSKSDEEIYNILKEGNKAMFEHKMNSGDTSLNEAVTLSVKEKDTSKNEFKLEDLLG